MARTLFRLFDQKKPGSDNLGIKKEVRVASTADIDLATGGLLTIDGVGALTAGDRVLVKNQGTPAQNGIYTVNVSTWPRALDSDEDEEVLNGEVVFVKQGTLGANTGWINSSATDPIIVGSSDQTFQKFTIVNAVEVSEFVNGELPGGAINGSNVTFTLANTPEPSTESLYFNGQRLRRGATEDYTITGLTITLAFAPKANPSQTDVLLADYIIA